MRAGTPQLLVYNKRQKQKQKFHSIVLSHWYISSFAIAASDINIWSDIDITCWLLRFSILHISLDSKSLLLQSTINKFTFLHTYTSLLYFVKVCYIHDVRIWFGPAGRLKSFCRRLHFLSTFVCLFFSFGRKKRKCIYIDMAISPQTSFCSNFSMSTVLLTLDESTGQVCCKFIHQNFMIVLTQHLLKMVGNII